ncbi:hypothetical protein Ssi03_74530 [Sphaerisporangium siamense]|uniref:Cytochrome c-type biogenesis protein CcmH/NrfG n=1 Tax=Sphaerisporangium siamense TaxID=795645 RepID=A0A7W7DAB6_9ACTN|nr:hypothetical protein [Sphaerisporangium siamense]MBB4702305.1 cytochrome c-type biogenesis protein CcmH/NrfG [Sphaerisporangium siamense]GII89463.1 hypothetical protein Ssi03_74530 [Sphaerisporangium siamense]
MATILAGLLAVAAVALCSLREATADARTPAQLSEAACRAGWWRCAGRGLLLVVVPALYVMAAGCWMCVHVARGTGSVLLVVAEHLVSLTARSSLEHA